MKNADKTVTTETIPPALLPHPSKLFVETTTRCNLACPMCPKHAQDSAIGDNHMLPQTFERLAPAFDNLQTLILNGIGEPLMHPQLENFIRSARARMPATGSIGFQSNGLLLDEKRAASLVEAGIDSICLSLDAITPETFRNVRQGGEVIAVQNAFAALTQAQRSGTKEPLRIGVEFVVRRDNLHELPEVIEWAASQGAHFAIVSHLMPYDASQTGQRAYEDNTDAAVAIYEKWRRIAADQGLNLQDYRQKAWSSERTKHQALVGLVKQMKAEARANDVFTNINQLFERDSATEQMTTDAFNRARKAAARHGLQLHLPSVLPRHNRNCAFIEDGGAFVSWDGKVHPCYNLWHGYRGYINDWERTVTPKVFGSVQEAGILEIWKQPDFLRFRQNVLRYDYPFCSNCSVAPCDYIEGEEFEQDCYISEEPCGACLWSMGLLQCLQ